MTKIRLFSLLLFILASQTAYGQTLPVKVKSQLNADYSGWKSYAGSSICKSRSVVSGNFNGDGKNDYAVMLKKGSSVYVVAFLSRSVNYKAHVLESGSAADLGDIFLSVGKKGERYSEKQRLLYDAPEGGTCEASSYYWIYKNGAFEQVFTSD